jgi:hypothetical protein
VICFSHVALLTDSCSFNLKKQGRCDKKAINSECEAAFSSSLFLLIRRHGQLILHFRLRVQGKKRRRSPAVGGNLACITHDRIAKQRRRRPEFAPLGVVDSNNNHARARSLARSLSTSQPPAFFIWGRIVKGAAGAITRINNHTQAREKCARMPSTALPRPLALSAEG